MITILAIGKKHEPWLVEAARHYEKQLRRPFTVSWKLLAHSHQSTAEARQNESQRLLQTLHDKDYVILLDEIGTSLTSPALSHKLEGLFNQAREITIIIGGAYGVDASVKQRADFIWSLSELVFPHQIVRLLLIEQLYRAQSIRDGSPYHHQ